MRALCLLREGLAYRRHVFLTGLARAGFKVTPDVPDPRPGDVVVIWNRYGEYDRVASRFERAGAKAIIVENGYLGKGWRGGSWFSMAIQHHAGAGQWNVGGPERWDEWSVPLAPFRTDGTETIILAQRGIGHPDVASPKGWAESVQRTLGTGRIREHPGKHDPGVPLVTDLAHASSVVTWASAAAFQALLLGVPVWGAYARWIGMGAARSLLYFGKEEPNRSEEARLSMFRRLAWAMWEGAEVESGAAFRHLLRLGED